MDNYICYKWNSADFSWLDAELTWKEACLIQKIAEQITHNRGRGKVGTSIHHKELDLTEEENETLIGLIVRIKQNGYIYNVDEKKTKREEIKVTSKDIKLFIKELEQVKLKVIL